MKRIIRVLLAMGTLGVLGMSPPAQAAPATPAHVTVAASAPAGCYDYWNNIGFFARDRYGNYIESGAAVDTSGDFAYLGESTGLAQYVAHSVDGRTWAVNYIHWEGNNGVVYRGPTTQLGSDGTWHGWDPNPYLWLDYSVPPPSSRYAQMDVLYYDVNRTSVGVHVLLKACP